MTVCCYGYPLCSCGDAVIQTPGEIVMSQEIVCAFPPIYEELAKVFRLFERRDVVFSFGSKLYNPHGVHIPDEIIAHEAVHGERQGETVAETLEWWQRYMDDPAFRLAEELPAHRAECQWILDHNPQTRAPTSNKAGLGKTRSPAVWPHGDGGAGSQTT